MSRSRCLTLVLGLVLIIAPDMVLARPGAPAPTASAPDLCRRAIAAAERAHGIPHALLLAIGRVESGRRDPETGRFGPWPWTIHAEGTGQYFATKEEAIAAVRALQARGVRSIDVGCMQVNLHHHPHAFSSLEEAFDPIRNADYAARFLVDLQARANSWTQAAAHYHSHTPDLAEAYKRRVLAAWPEETRHAAEAHRHAQAAAWVARTATGAGRTIHVVPAAPRSAPALLAEGPGLAGSGSRGRDLDSYRAAPIASARPIALLAQLSVARPAAQQAVR
ncbi:MAG: lytic transglycosylase domain-containing protein [Elioraea sp.]|nr:lytic transglycosylase domain-containing protein [Elioraea sp.]